MARLVEEIIRKSVSLTVAEGTTFEMTALGGAVIVVEGIAFIKVYEASQTRHVGMLEANAGSSSPTAALFTNAVPFGFIGLSSVVPRRLLELTHNNTTGCDTSTTRHNDGRVESPSPSVAPPAEASERKKNHEAASSRDDGYYGRAQNPSLCHVTRRRTFTKCQQSLILNALQ